MRCKKKGGGGGGGRRGREGRKMEEEKGMEGGPKTFCFWLKFQITDERTAVNTYLNKYNES